MRLGAFELALQVRDDFFGVQQRGGELTLFTTRALEAGANLVAELPRWFAVRLVKIGECGRRFTRFAPNHFERLLVQVLLRLVRTLGFQVSNGLPGLADLAALFGAPIGNLGGGGENLAGA